MAQKPLSTDAPATTHAQRAARSHILIDGPFTETKELLAGYWLWQVRSMEEAIEWVRRIPNPTGEHGVVEIRPVFEADDFGEDFTPELPERARPSPIVCRSHRTAVSVPNAQRTR